MPLTTFLWLVLGVIIAAAATIAIAFGLAVPGAALAGSALLLALILRWRAWQ